jgi:peptidylprolyl isomerase
MVRPVGWRAHLPALGIAFALALGGGVLPAAAESGSEIVARLGSTDVTIDDLKDFVHGLDPATREQAAKDSQLLARLVRVELARMAVLSEAKEKHWEDQPDVARQIERARNQTIVATYLASVATPPAAYPSEAEIQAFYEQNRDRFMLPRQYHLSQIFVASPSGAEKAAEETARKRAEDLAKKAKAKGANFADLARKNSDEADSAKNGGDLGWLAENQIVPEIRTIVAGMTKSEISEPIRTQAGWHIVTLADTKPAGPRPLAEIHDAVAQGLRQRKLEENQQAYLGKLLESRHAAVNEIGLAKLLEVAK